MIFRIKGQQILNDDFLTKKSAKFECQQNLGDTFNTKMSAKFEY